MTVAPIATAAIGTSMPMCMIRIAYSNPRESVLDGQHGPQIDILKRGWVFGVAVKNGNVFQRRSGFGKDIKGIFDFTQIGHTGGQDQPFFQRPQFSQIGQIGDLA